MWLKKKSLVWLSSIIVKSSLSFPLTWKVFYNGFHIRKQYEPKLNCEFIYEQFHASKPQRNIEHCIRNTNVGRLKRELCQAPESKLTLGSILQCIVWLILGICKPFYAKKKNLAISHSYLTIGIPKCLEVQNKKSFKSCEKI